VFVRLREGKEVKLIENKVTVNKEKNILNITKAHMSDAANYTCVVNYKLENGTTAPVQEEFIAICKYKIGCIFI
jgi:hypothetical protein